MSRRTPKADKVVLTSAPPELLAGLPAEDQAAVTAIVGKPVALVGYDEDGRAELQFTDDRGVIHFLFVAPSLLRPIA